MDCQIAKLQSLYAYNYANMQIIIDSECVYLQRTLDCKKKTPTSPNRSERLLIRKTGWGTIEREGDRWTEIERTREGGCSAL